jgi:hypothetical protein
MIYGLAILAGVSAALSVFVVVTELFDTDAIDDAFDDFADDTRPTSLLTQSSFHGEASNR